LLRRIWSIQSCKNWKKHFNNLWIM